MVWYDRASHGKYGRAEAEVRVRGARRGECVSGASRCGAWVRCDK